MKCPSCGSTDVRLSKRRRAAAPVLRLFGYRRYRCRTCWHGFWHVAGASVPERTAEAGRPNARSRYFRRRRRLLIIEAVLFLVMLVIFVVAIRYFVNRRTDGSEAAPRPPGRILENG